MFDTDTKTDDSERKICRDCGDTFTATAGERDWLTARGLNPNVSRCKPCRAQRRALAQGGAVERETRPWR